VLKPGGVFLARTFVRAHIWRRTTVEVHADRLEHLALLIFPHFPGVKIGQNSPCLVAFFAPLNVAGDTFVRYNLARAIYRHTVCPMLNLPGLGFESLPLTTNDHFAANDSIFATK